MKELIMSKTALETLAFNTFNSNNNEEQLCADFENPALWSNGAQILENPALRSNCAQILKIRLCGATVRRFWKIRL
jgi:hypothetical protein